MAKKQSPDKNGVVQAPEPKWADYQETILVRNPTSGEVDSVSDPVQKGNRYEVHTTEACPAVFIVSLPKELLGKSRSVVITPVLHKPGGYVELED